MMVESKAQHEILIEIAAQQRMLNALIKTKFENTDDRLLRDWMRGISYINRLHAKALDWEAGLIPINHHEYTSREKMLAQSSAWLEQLKQNQNPWNGRFAEIDGLCVDHAFFKA